MNGVILLLAREKLVSFHRNQERKIQRVLILMISPKHPILGNIFVATIIQ